MVGVVVLVVEGKLKKSFEDKGNKWWCKRDNGVSKKNLFSAKVQRQGPYFTSVTVLRKGSPTQRVAC